MKWNGGHIKILGLWILFLIFTLTIAASLVFMVVAMKDANFVSSAYFDKFCGALQLSILGLLFLAILIGCFLE